MDDKKEIMIMLVLLLALGFTWYKVWVEPNDEYRRTIIECMDGDRSRAAYDDCISLIRKTK